MTTSKKAQKTPFIAEATEAERLENYIRFQISQAEEMLKPHVGMDKGSFKVYHIISWRRKLLEELNSLHKK